MNRSEIIRKAELHVRGLYNSHPNPVLAYHNLEHAEQVAKYAAQIASHYRLEEQETQAVHIAAWFHDTGYLFGYCNEHEEKSTELATSFLEEEKASPDLIVKVRECIMATKIFCRPPSLIAKIIADADLFHFGTADFRKINEKMWIEMKRCIGEKIPADKWQKGALMLLEKHRFHTDYCQNHLQEGKEENMDFLREWLEVNCDNPKGETMRKL